MKLKSLQIYSNRVNGLSCEALNFSDHITHIYGPNGCGKTPVIKSIAFCLGYPAVFRNDIYERCEMVSLEIKVGQNAYKIIRQFSREFDIEVIDHTNVRERFFSESEFSEFLFKVLGLDYPNLVSSRGEVAKPYISTLLPLLIADQDNGYTAAYAPPSRFIQDQFQEMVRLLFNLPPKNFFDAKKERLESKRRLEYLDEQVKKKEEIQKTAQEEVIALGRSSDDITEEIGLLESELEDITTQNSTKADSMRTFDKMISQRLSQIRDLEASLSDISRRRKSISVMIDEINSETNALSLNEASRQVFLSFQEICSNPNCGLFAASSDSYAKNLLYLKDQIKDLARTDAIYGRDELRIQSEVLSNTKLVEELKRERQRSEQGSETAALVASVSNLKDRLFQLQTQLSEHTELLIIETEYVALLNKRNAAVERYESFKSVRANTPDLARIRADLRKSFINWLDKLHTVNVSRDITFRNDFEPVMGKERISQLSGSTKVRAILAFHAALIEVLVNEKSPIKLLVLDTPKQHEIHNDDLDRYFNALKQVCKKGGVQVIFSTTEYKYTGDDFDTTWEPRYDGQDQKMFLESSSQSGA